MRSLPVFAEPPVPVPRGWCGSAAVEQMRRGGAGGRAVSALAGGAGEPESAPRRAARPGRKTEEAPQCSREASEESLGRRAGAGGGIFGRNEKKSRLGVAVNTHLLGEGRPPRRLAPADRKESSSSPPGLPLRKSTASGGSRNRESAAPSTTCRFYRRGTSDLPDTPFVDSPSSATHSYPHRGGGKIPPKDPVGAVVLRSAPPSLPDLVL